MDIVDLYCIRDNNMTCTLLPRNEKFYRQITSQEKDGAVGGGG